MKNLFLLFALLGFFAINVNAQTAATAKKATPTVKIEKAQDDTDGKKEASTACCKGKSAKDCCKGKKGDAKAYAEKQESGLQTAEGNKVQSASGTKPACCAGKKSGTSCAGMKAESSTVK